MALRVLVADDQMPVRLLCRLNLQAEGMEILEAEDGVRALELATGDEPPDVILLDVKMPRLDGWSVAESLLADPATSSIPIIFFSARAGFADQARGFDIGGVDYLTKPFDPTALLETVRVHLGGVPGEPDDDAGR
jgi:putative two-component system response regulator